MDNFILLEHMNKQADKLYIQECMIYEMQQNILSLNERINKLENKLSLEGVRIG